MILYAHTESVYEYGYENALLEVLVFNQDLDTMSSESTSTHHTLEHTGPSMSTAATPRLLLLVATPVYYSLKPIH